MNTDTPTTHSTKPRHPRTKKPVILPTQPSKLIRLALRDLAKCEAQPDKFKIDMSNWFTVNSRCSVCLAGAVMAQRLDGENYVREKGRPSCDNRKFIVDDDLPADNMKQLKALNFFRLSSMIDKGISALAITSSVQNRPICAYDADPIKFREDMLALARDFEKEGN